MAKDWIKGAIKHPGAFTKKAKAQGKSPIEYAREVMQGGLKVGTRTKKQAALAMTLSNMRHK